MTTVSLQTIAGAFDTSDNLLSPALVQTIGGGSLFEDGTSILTLVFNVDGEIPTDGLVVTVNGDIPLRDYFRNLATEPFSRGGEVLEAVYDPKTGEATGFKFKIDQPNAILNLPVKDDSTTNEPKPATFALEAGVGYTVNPDADTSSVTFYDTLEQVPALTVTPEVSLTADNTALDESAGNTTTLTFNLNEPPPAEGVLVYVKGAGQPGGEGNPAGRDLAEFDIFNAEITGGVFPAANFAANGFYFKITEPTATIAVPAFDDEYVEGIEEINFSLQEVPGYTIAKDAGAVSLTIADNSKSQVQVSLNTEPAVLVESEETASIHTFSLSTTPPEEGVTVKVEAPNLSEFNQEAIAVEGGEITAVRDDGFDFKITAKDATINLPVANDGKAEKLEEATFTLEAGENYQVSPDANSGTFTIADAPELAPASTEESNDTLETAIDTRLTAANPNATFEGEIAQYSVEDDQGNLLVVDATEDVDLYKVDLLTGGTVAVNVDAASLDSKLLYSSLRIFDASGKELARTSYEDYQAAPDEVFTPFGDPYLEFTAEADGTYYIGLSQTENETYDPLKAGSGSGQEYPDFGIEPDAYTLNLSLVPA